LEGTGEKRSTDTGASAVSDSAISAGRYERITGKLRRE
jgi:hypothetical protein